MGFIIIFLIVLDFDEFEFIRYRLLWEDILEFFEGIDLIWEFLLLFILICFIGLGGIGGGGFFVILDIVLILLLVFLFLLLLIEVYGFRGGFFI